MLAIIFFLHIDTPKSERLTVFQQINHLNPIGTFFFIPSIICLVLPLQWGGTMYAWSAPKITSLLFTFAVLFLAFCLVQVLKPDTAMVPVRIITQ